MVPLSRISETEQRADLLLGGCAPIVYFFGLVAYRAKQTILQQWSRIVDREHAIKDIAEVH